jgi:hypothetical protein
VAAAAGAAVGVQVGGVVALAAAGHDGDAGGVEAQADGRAVMEQARVGGERLGEAPGGGRVALVSAHEDFSHAVEDDLALEGLVAREGEAGAVGRVLVVEVAEVGGGLAQADPADGHVGCQGALGVGAAPARLDVRSQFLGLLQRLDEGSQVMVPPGATAV